VNMAYNPPSNPPRMYADAGSKPMRPKSAVSYTRRKYSFDGSKQGNPSVMGNGDTSNAGGYRRGSTNGSQSDKFFGWGKNASVSAARAESIIDRVVNYGKDTPHYLLAKGAKQVVRAQSAGPTRRVENISGNGPNASATPSIVQFGRFPSTGRVQKSKQLAMMYAEELIEKLDHVIVTKNINNDSNSISRSSGADPSGDSNSANIVIVYIISMVKEVVMKVES